MSSEKQIRETSRVSRRLANSIRYYYHYPTNAFGEDNQQEQKDQQKAALNKGRRCHTQGFCDNKTELTPRHRSCADYLCAIFNPVKANKTPSIRTVCFQQESSVPVPQLPDGSDYTYYKTRWEMELTADVANDIVHPNIQEVIGLPYCWFAPSDDVFFYTLPVIGRKNAIFSVLEQISISFGVDKVGSVIWDYAGATAIYFFVEISSTSSRIDRIAYTEDLDCDSVECSGGYVLSKAQKISYFLGYENL